MPSAQVLVAEPGEVDVEFGVVRRGLDGEFVGGVLAEPFRYVDRLAVLAERADVLAASASDAAVNSSFSAGSNITDRSWPSCRYSSTSQKLP
ncbi:hypothetical protein ABZX90_29060 [Streptomyces sp. NPDC002935]|uniref:hypothetical protein n=1 Tax=Streptomyces sp. NPDC002935 TaxID=3154545 RepID=UPI0033ACAE35